MTKSRAFKSPFGTGISERVTAKQIERRRQVEFNGQPTGERYFSTHKPGQRLPVKHVMKGSTSFFAYIDGGSNGGGVGGESLNHLLFKEALLTVQAMKLSLLFNSGTNAQKRINVQVTIMHAESEKKLTTENNGSRHIDIYLEYETEHYVGKKWEGKLYLEVHNTHAVDAEKQVALRALSVPVVEVDIPDVFTYKISDDNTTDELEERHRAFIKRTLESSNGFLQGVVLSNPSSKAYLEDVIIAQQKTFNKTIVEHEAALNEVNKKYTQTSKELKEVGGSLRQIKIDNLALSSQLDELSKKFASKTCELDAALENARTLEMVGVSLAGEKQSIIVHNRLLIFAFFSLFVFFLVFGWFLI